ncbi:nuclear transcription factor Y subunit gamma-like [Anopheles cruzii]|uniref:nuclear transcription factor Y subunit gamma-like n=1 Tax=Anopheles cruzii TaxID=68878 RepID=UPI0022EC51FB|nr:nuclear transcription factor Y subunit gamma-like [Anopheles cruzii]
MSQAQKNIHKFWPNIMREMQATRNVKLGRELLSLRRIKKIMKLDEDVHWISSETLLLFAKAIEMFENRKIETVRAWLHTEDDERRRLRRSDIVMATSKYDQFDFLIDIVPRDDKKDYTTIKAAGVVEDDTQYSIHYSIFSAGSEGPTSHSYNDCCKTGH